MFPTDVVILAGARTPMAPYNGAFKDISAIELGSPSKGRWVSTATRPTSTVGPLLWGIRWPRPARVWSSPS